MRRLPMTTAMVIAALVLLQMLQVCCQRPNPKPPAPPPANSTDLVIRLRPIILDPVPDLSAIDAKLSFAVEIYAKAGIKLDVLPAIEQPDPVLSVVDSQVKWERLCQATMDRANSVGELAVYFVHTLAPSGNQYGGLSNYPWNLPGTKYQWGTVLSASCAMDSVAHELGHSLGLTHTPGTGTTTANSDCSATELRCDIMSYCFQDVLQACTPFWLTTEQINTMRSWATASPRTLVCSGKSPELAAKRSSLRYTTSTAPVE